MGGGTGHLPGRDVKRDIAMHVYISYLLGWEQASSVYIEIIFYGKNVPANILM